MNINLNKNIKKLLSCATLTLNFGLITLAHADEERALQLYARRGENISFAQQAANEYKELASNSSDALTKAKFKTNEAKALYYVGAQMPSEPKQARLDKLTEGYTAAQTAIDLLSQRPGVAKKTAFNSALASAHYWYSANLGKWGEVKGILASLGKWPELKERLQFIMNLDPTVNEYGAHRIMGRAYMKVPRESKAEGLAFLNTANNETLVTVNDLTLSKNPTNVNYYLEALAEQNQTAKFCKLYDTFSEFSEAVSDDASLLEQYNPELIPETLNELKIFNSDEADLKNFYDKNC